MRKKISRAEKAGRDLGEAIIEMINLMYQDKTAENFLRGLMKTLHYIEVRRLGGTIDYKDK